MTAPKDHNRGPAFDQHEVDELSLSAEEFLTASQKWLDQGALTSDIQAAQLTDQIDGLRGLAKKVEDARKAAKQPHLDAGKAVDAAYGAVKSKLDTCIKALKKMADIWLALKRDEAEEARRAKEAEAKAKADEAAKLAAAAEDGANIQATLAAEKAAEEAEAARKAAAAPAEVQMKSMSGAGRTISQRTVREVEITNIRQLFLHYQDRDEVHELLKRLAQADVRAKDVDESAIPGIIIQERKVAA